MSTRDYICCDVCSEKLIYDGDDTIRYKLEIFLHINDDRDEYLSCICPKCSASNTLEFTKDFIKDA